MRACELQVCEFQAKLLASRELLVLLVLRCDLTSLCVGKLIANCESYQSAHRSKSAN